MPDAHVLAPELDGPNAARAWRALEREAWTLAQRPPEVGPERWVREAASLEPWLTRTVDPLADAILHRALSAARGTPAAGPIHFALGKRAALRGELTLAPAHARAARAAGAAGEAIDLLEAHAAIRTGRPSLARARVAERAKHDPHMRAQQGFLLLSEGRWDDATSVLEHLRATGPDRPILAGVSSFFLAEAATRRGAWERALLELGRWRGAMACFGFQIAHVTAAAWEARALRHLGRPDLARERARWSWARALELGVAEAMIEAAIERFELAGDDAEREAWRGEIAALGPSAARPEVRHRAEALTDLDAPRSGVEIDAAGGWLRVGGERIDLASRPTLGRILRALVAAPGPVDTATLFTAGWPGERIRLESRSARVYTAVWQLRRLGVPLTSGPDGYALGDVAVH